MMIRDRIKEFRRVPASELRPSPKNWRSHPQQQKEALQGILAEIGYADALLARELPDGTLELVDGHLRAETTPEQQVPVLVLDLTEDEAAKLLLTLDPLSAMATADAGKLDALLREVQTGSEALAGMLTQLATDNGVLAALTGDKPEVQEDEAPVDRAAELQAKWGTATGQLWVIPSKTVPGKSHRLLCGDSTKAEDVQRVMGGERAGLCFTSPPYDQQRDYGQKIGDWLGLMKGVFANLPMADDGQVLVNLGLIHRDGEWVPYWEPWIAWMREQGWRRFGWYVWDQGYGLPGDWQGRLAPSHEFVFHFNRESVKPTKTKDCVYAGEINRDTDSMKSAGGKGFTHAGRPVQDKKIPDSVIREYRQQAHSDSSHPAVFSVAFAASVVEAWPGLCYEPFSGSGTTIVAGEQLGRLCYGLELEPKYIAVALERLALLGLSPRLIQ